MSEPGDALARGLTRAAAARGIPGNAVTALADAPATLDRMLAFIHGARHTLHFENYIIRSDATGRRFAEALAAAAGRGVAVRVLYDALGCRGTRRGYWRRLRRAGVEALAFHPVNPFRPLRSIRRDHRKYVGADGARAVVGGICVGDEWRGAAGPAWRDTAVEVCGPAVPALDLTFRRLWADAGGTPPDQPLGPAPDPCGAATVRVIEGIPGKLRLVRAIELLAGSAARRLWVTDAYLVPPLSLFATLLAVARDGADVRILVPGRTDLPIVRSLTRTGYRELLEAGARIWEWHGPMLHAKTVLVDDRWFKVGSSNLNPSSLFSNYEIDLLIDDAAVAQDAARQFRRDLTNAVEVVLRPRLVPVTLAGRLPPAVVPARDPGPQEPKTPRERTQRAAIALWRVAGGARRSLAGAALSSLVGIGALLVALPRTMAYLLAALAFGFAGLGAWHVFGRRREGRAP